MTKKAQIQNMETITVVIIIIILIVIGVVYASNQRRSSLEEERQRVQDLEAMKVATNTLNLEFLKCSEARAISDICIDYFKIKALSEKSTLDENIFYFNSLFGDSNIQVNILKNISLNQENENITLFEVPIENKTTIKTRIPVTVKDAVRDINFFAIMEVSVFR